jgi:hypothetical protein
MGSYIPSKERAMSAQDVLNHHLGAFASGNTDEILKDYTEASALIFPDTTYRGIAAIRGIFTQVLTGIFKPGTYEFIMDRVEIEGTVAYIVWHATTSAGEVRMASDTFVFQDGKIAVQTFAMLLEPK